MKLTSHSGRTIELTPPQAAEFLLVAQRWDEQFARELAFGGQLASQVTPEMLAARAQVKVARRARQRNKRERARQQLRRRSAARQLLTEWFPGLHPHVVTRIFHRGRHLLPRPGYTGRSWEPEPMNGQRLDDETRSMAQSDIQAYFNLLNANDWKRIRPLVPNEFFQAMVQHANPEALAAVL